MLPPFSRELPSPSVAIPVSVECCVEEAREAQGERGIELDGDRQVLAAGKWAASAMGAVVRGGFEDAGRTLKLLRRKKLARPLFQPSPQHLDSEKPLLLVARFPEWQLLIPAVTLSSLSRSRFRATVMSQPTVECQRRPRLTLAAELACRRRLSATHEQSSKDPMEKRGRNWMVVG
ncbi:hypothetical protein HDV00_009695 [Rhizophlyctis rosea]|nr:hypothetical protein HDV00_009695 [Rhizophlyctis rosea]